MFGLSQLHYWEGWSVRNRCACLAIRERSGQEVIGSIRCFPGGGEEKCRWVERLGEGVDGHREESALHRLVVRRARERLGVG